MPATPPSIIDHSLAYDLFEFIASLVICLIIGIFSLHTFNAMESSWRRPF